MEPFYPSLYMRNSNWLMRPSTTEWTREENKRFESALAIFGEHEPRRWEKVAAMIPGKTVYDVKKQYKELLNDVTDIEEGRFPLPGYDLTSSNFTLQWVDNDDDDDDDDRNFDTYRKRPSSLRSSDQERKKGVPWTEDEHRRFLLGLLKHGKGDWRNISRNFVVSKTPTQVASHAQKYFLRQQLSGVKDKRRPSIHDITTLNLTDASSAAGKNKLTPRNNSVSVDHGPSDQVNMYYSSSDDDQKSVGVLAFTDHVWNYHKINHDEYRAYDSAADLVGNFFMSPSINGLKFQGRQNLFASTAHINHPRNLVFQMPSTRYQIRG